MWLDDRTPALFEQFVSTAVAHVNRRLVEIHGERPLQWFVTINEPNMLVINTYLNRHFPGGGQRGMKVAVTAYNRLLAAHVRAYNAVHDLFESEGWPAPRVTMNTFCSDVYWSEKMLLDLLCLRERGVRSPELKAYLQAGSSGLHQALLKADLPFHSDPFVWLGQSFFAFWSTLSRPSTLSWTHLTLPRDSRALQARPRLGLPWPGLLRSIHWPPLSAALIWGH